jgi:hypothetical protein
LVPILQAVDSTNVVLINAVAPPSFFEWIDEDVKRTWKLGQPGRFTQATQSVLLNLHSQQDSANKYLFRLASVIDTTRIVFDHSDIYKGRMATLIANLFYDQETRRILESPGSAMGDCL